MYLGSRPLDALARNLLATSCLTLAAGATAQAGVFNESTDLPNSGPGLALPTGTTEVNGSLIRDPEDNFQFVGLLPGSSFSVIFSDRGGLSGLIQVFNTSNQLFGSGKVVEGDVTPTISGTVPTDGKLVVRVSAIEEGGGFYRVTLNAASDVPEPATVIPAGLTIAGALAWQRRKKAVN